MPLDAGAAGPRRACRHRVWRQVPPCSTRVVGARRLISCNDRPRESADQLRRDTDYSWWHGNLPARFMQWSTTRGANLPTCTHFAVKKLLIRVLWTVANFGFRCDCCETVVNCCFAAFALIAAEPILYKDVRYSLSLSLSLSLWTHSVSAHLVDVCCCASLMSLTQLVYVCWLSGAWLIPSLLKVRITRS
jgi:hypothetical protein